MDTLTERQKAVLDFMVESVTKRGVPPTVREIGDQFSISSPNGVMCHLRALEKKGYLMHEGNGSHTWRPKYRPIDVTCPHCSCEIEVIEELS